MNKILYIGNNLSKKSKYNSALDTLSNFFIKEGFEIKISSNKQNKLLRLVDMCVTLFSYRKKVDVVLIDTFSTQNFYYAYIISQLARYFKIQYIPILHGGNLPIRILKCPKMSKKIFKNSKVNVSPSNYLKNEFEKNGFNTVLIPNVLDIKLYQFKKREKFAPKLLWVRAFDKTYNPTMAIEVLRELKKTYANASLCMIGPNKDGSLRSVQEKITTFDLSDSVEITGVLPMEEWHKKSEEYDIFINTTNFDNMPVSVIEAMALGLPVISTNVGGMPYLIENNETGVLVDANNAAQMTTAVITIIENPKQSVKISNNARLKVEKYDWSIVKKQWMNLLN